MKYLLLILFAMNAHAAELQTNATYMADPPPWITKNRIDKVVDRIQTFMEWDIHRVNVVWYKDQAAFERMHGLGPAVLAISKKDGNSIHLGPKVTSANFDPVFGHELVHVCSFQKYKGAIPPWLEEGLANEVSKFGPVDYAFLAKQPLPKDVRDLTHPFGGTLENTHYHYMASQALIEMIAAKCDLRNLLRLSVGQKMDVYLDTYCGFQDLNASYKKWLVTKSGGALKN